MIDDIEDDAEEDFKQNYATQLHAMITECMWGENGHQAMLVIAHPRNKTVSMYAVNANEHDAREMLLSAAEVYRNINLAERVLN